MTVNYVLGYIISGISYIYTSSLLYYLDTKRVVKHTEYIVLHKNSYVFAMCSRSNFLFNLFDEVVLYLLNLLCLIIAWKIYRKRLI